MKKLICLFLSFSLMLPFLFAQSNIEILDNYIEKVYKDWNLPGLSIAVVKDGKILLSKGYGIRALDGNEKVNSKTLFGAMSTTKAMTAVGMAILVDEGKVNWDDRVIEHLPHFKVADAYVTRELKIRDLFTHNAGLGNADFLWAWTPDLSAEKVVERMQHAEPAYSFRGGFTYQNIMYLVAGQIVEEISGKPWEDFMAERVFSPLGMNNTFPNMEGSKSYKNRSVAHYEIDGHIQQIPETTADPIAPAGAVWSTSDDIAKWVNFMLDSAKIEGKSLLKTATWQELIKPQVVIPSNQFYPTMQLTKPHWTTYGFGWFQHDYRGEMVNFHTGSLAGRTAIAGLLVDKKIGVYIFGNLDHAELRHALMYKVFDLFAFDDNSRDWSADMKVLYDGIAKDWEDQRKEVKKKRIMNTAPSLSVHAYTGIYKAPFYGTAIIELQDGYLKLVLSPTVQANLNHWHFETFEADWDKAWWGESLLAFKLDPVSGAVKSLEILGAEYFKKEK